MKKFIKEEEFDEYFDKYWHNIKKEFFKCETLQYYNEPEEYQFFSLFRAGQFKQLHKLLKEDVQGKESVWNEARKKKIHFIRVHVFNIPLSEYIKFEVEAYKIQSKIGSEKIWMVPQKILKQKILKKLKDFMLFDNTRAIIVEYNPQCSIIGATLTDEKEDIKHLCRLKDYMLEKGIPINKFIKACNLYHK